MKKLLVVEDDQLIQGLLLDILELENYEVKIAESAEEAKETLTDYHPDCMIIDVMLPGMTGDQLVTEIKEQNLNGSPAIVMMSALSPADAARKSKHADAFIKKPFEMEELLSVLERFTSE